MRNSTNGIAGLLRAMLADATLPEAFWHPVGFIVCRLATFSHGESLRLHIWPSEAREYDAFTWPVHDHIWSMVSNVLCGSLRNEIVSVHSVDEGEGIFRLFVVDYVNSQKSTLRNTGISCTMRPVSSSVLGPGDRYGVPAGTYHASSVAKGVYCATLVSTGLPRLPAPHVVGIEIPSDEILVARKPVNPGFLLEQVRLLLDNLSDRKSAAGWKCTTRLDFSCETDLDGVT